MVVKVGGLAWAWRGGKRVTPSPKSSLEGACLSQPSQLLITNVGAVCVKGAMDEPPRLEEPLLPSHKPAVFTALRTLAVASALVVGTTLAPLVVGAPAPS